MMSKNNKISNAQLFIILLATIVGPTALRMPNVLAIKVGTDGWLTIVVGALIGLVLVTLVAKVALKYPDKTFVEIARHLMPRPIANIVIVIFIVHFLSIAAFDIRMLMELVKLFLFDQTPNQFIGIAFCILVIYMVRGGIESIGRFITVSIFFVLLPTFLISTAVIKEINLENYLPVFQTDFTTILKALPCVILPMAGFEMLYIYVSFVKEKKEKTLKYSLGVMGLVSIIYLALFLVSIGKYGESSLRYQLWPVISLVKTIQMPAAFIENLDGLAIAIWILAAFMTVSSFTFVSSLVTSRLFNTKEQKPFIIPTIILIYILSTIPQNIMQAYDYTEKLCKVTGTISLVIVPILFFILSKLKDKEVSYSDEK